MTAMASPMGPPMLPAYSLRVQLFAPTAHSIGDKPIRCFRVVTSPEITIREFCEEASRIHEINYGQPLAIKKVQDDQEFDITQSEILGNLFATTATIRVVQASANSTVRDSIPPTSALRFDPTTSRKRDRSSPMGLKSHKRQRIAELDPDQPLPSREVVPAHANGYVPEVIVPNSQESVIPGSSTRHVRPQQIEETPEPTALPCTPFHKNGIADTQGSKNNADRSSPLREASARAQSYQVNGKAKSASYHIERATERGTSVSTAATSPPSDGQRNAQAGNTTASKRKRKEHIHRSLNEDTIYDTIASEDESVKASKPKKLSLKARNSPNGLPGMEWAKNKALNTPANVRGRSSASREPTTNPGELPLTPSSKEREARKRERKEEEEAKKARLSAAQAAEQRQREAEEARLEKERQTAEVERSKREEEERRQVEEFNRAEPERKAKAEKMQREKEAREAREAEAARVAVMEADRRRKETEAALKRAEGEKRQEEARATREKAKGKGGPKKKKEDTPDSRERISPSPILPRSNSRAQSSTPHIPTGRASSMKSILKPSSSPARPSPEQSSNDSNVLDGLPSAKPRQRTVSFDVETEPPAIRSESRIVPPKLSASKAKTPIQPPKRSLTSKTAPQPSKPSPAPSSKQSASVSAAKSENIERSASPAVANSIAPRSKSAILPPTKITPIPPPPRKISSTKPAPPKPVQPLTANEKSKLIAKAQTIEISEDESEESEDESGEESEEESDEDVEMTDAPTAKKGNQSPVDTKVVQNDLENEEDDGSESSTSDSDVEMTGTRQGKENRVSTTKLDNKDEANEPQLDQDENEPKLPEKKTAKKATASPKPEPNPNVEEEEEVELEDPEATQSQNSSPRESRSPVIFSQNPSATTTAKLHQIPPLDPSEKEQSDDETTPRPNSRFITNPALLQEDTTSTSDSESSDEEEAQIQVPKSSPPRLPSLSARKTVNSRPSMSQTSSKGQSNTQSEVDNQLTSSLARPHSSTPVPIPASSTVTQPPIIKFGASLSTLNKQRNLVATSSQLKAKSTINSLQKAEEESESDDSEDSSSSSEDESDLHLPTRASVSTPKQKQKVTEEDDSDTSSTSDSGEDDSDSQRVKDELSKKIAAVKKSTVSPSKSVTQSASKIYGKQKSNKYLIGYSFSQPSI